jgi:hypothetical protein
MFKRCNGCSKLCRIWALGICRKCYQEFRRLSPKTPSTSQVAEFGDGT